MFLSKKYTTRNNKNVQNVYYNTHMPLRSEFRGMRRSRRARRLRLLAWRAFFGASALALLFFGLSWFSFYAPFQIKKVVIVGVNNSSRVEELRAEAEVARAFREEGIRLFSPTNFLLYPRAALAAAVASSSPRIASAAAARGGGIVIVVVSERAPFAEWCSSTSECIFIDENGFGFPNAKGDAPPISNVVFVGESPRAGARYLLHEKFLLLRDIVYSAERIGLIVKKVKQEEGDDFSLSLADNAEARFVLSFETAKIFLELPTILQAANLKISGGSVYPALQYLDMRFGGQVVFKRI
ncbi:MAG: hypothetical protein A2938_00975 [Candidatus Taylorbacteria bacterium RIFCSPLOWO2_01_FULL_48_100]|uniref:POTRA domain-containing protein n=1 Tax=Candidatus Taylorbacteria bacterium RIFCSPLOWO2_01_FULL_48_100 TaxID=1802322 RepID=A0A1G2NE94_9BACT|nr:MAG: hypothetical protein A2938_00975 [Candidatus Taylorbacteria bacterium RIFCSPLOWO2_01_FULL_48_100]